MPASRVPCEIRMMRIPAAGAVPAGAAFKATDTALKESPAGVIVTVMPGLIAAAAACTEYSEAWCALASVPQAMSASSKVKPVPAAKFVAAWPLPGLALSYTYVQIRFPPLGSLFPGVKLPDATVPPTLDPEVVLPRLAPFTGDTVATL